jgi:hypothetical protein
VGGPHPKKTAQKKWRMGREPLSAIIGGANRKFSFTYYLYALCCHGNTIHSILAVTLATTGLLYHLDQKPEYHHERHLVLFALLDWFLIPSPLRYFGIQGLGISPGPLRALVKFYLLTEARFSNFSTSKISS